MLKKIVIGLVVLVGASAAAAGVFVAIQTSAFDSSLAKKYEVPLPEVTRSTDAAVLERGKHLAMSLGGCIGCHGDNLAGGKVEKMGPVATFHMPNITGGKNGALASYSDAELVRLVKHGIKRDGMGVRFMPSQDYQWWPMEDYAALASYLRTVPAVDTEPVTSTIGTLGKVLDRTDKMMIDVARRIDHQKSWPKPTVGATVEYGASLGKLCQGCHGAGLSGGPLPGAPPEVPIPTNLTAHESGMKDWTIEEFDTVLKTGIRKNGSKCAPMMPIEITKNFDETEVKALWAYLRSVPPKPFGGR